MTEEIIKAVSGALNIGIKTHPCPNKRAFHGEWFEIVLPAGQDSSFYISIPGDAYKYLKNGSCAKMTENTKDETIKHLEELLRQKSDLIENMEKEIARLKKMIELGITEEDLFTDIKYPAEL